jgi:RNA polymerase sigma-70 factor (ECF subfamily)
MSYQIPDDVIRRAQAGDEDAQKRIIATFTRPIRVTVNRFLGTRFPNEVDDFVQDVFLRIFSHIRDFDLSRGVKFSTWTYTFVRNYCFDQMKRKRLPTFSLSSSVKGDEASAEWVGDSEPPERKSERREFAGALRRALNDLPMELRRIFKLREFEGHEFQAIARKLRLPLGTVKSKHYRALDRLRYSLRSFQVAC